MRHAPHIAWQRVYDEVIVVDLCGRRALGFNPVGSLVWELIPGHDEPEIVLTVADRFGIPPDLAARDVRTFLADLEHRGLVEAA